MWNTIPARVMRKKDRLIEQVVVEVRRMGALSVLVSNAVAARFDLNTSDLECLDLICMKGESTPGDLARATGLTTGAVTALVDRLQDAGYVVRDSDPADRRRVVIRVVKGAVKPVAATYAPMQGQMTRLWGGYSEAQLETIIDFLRRSGDASVECCEQIAKQPRVARAPRRARMPKRK